MPDCDVGLFGWMGSDWDFDAWVTIAEEAERLGYSALWCQDNIIGHSPSPPEIQLFDPWVLLPALAARTTTIRLGPLASPVTRRYAPQLAKAAASLDVISGGRLNLGVGAGDDAHQHEMLGWQFPPQGQVRRAMLRETLQVMKLLWSRDDADFDGEYVRLKNAVMYPKPVQQPWPPLYVSLSSSRKTMPYLAAEEGDAIACHWGTDEVNKSILRSFRERWAALGRSESSIRALLMCFVFFSDTDGPSDANLQRSQEVIGIEFDYSRYGSLIPGKDNEEALKTIYGRPEFIAEQLNARALAVGFNELAVLPFSLSSPVDAGGLAGNAGNYFGSLRVFSEEVVPRLRRP